MAIKMTDFNQIKRMKEIMDLQTNSLIESYKETLNEISFSFNDDKNSLKKIKVYCEYETEWNKDLTAKTEVNLSVILLNKQNKVCLPEKDNIVFYNNQKTKGVTLTSKKLQGLSNTLIELIEIDLLEIPKEVDKIMLFITIYEARKRLQTFKKIKNLKISVIDQINNKTLYLLKKINGDFEDLNFESSLELGFLKKTTDKKWIFKETKIEKELLDLNEIVNEYR